MAGTTSLLKSASSLRKKIQQQEDAEVAFNWANSAQTYDQFLEYSKFLETRQNQTSDPSQRLSYAKNIISARRSYTSNELQRQQMDIMEGRATTSDKMEAVKGLYYQAVDNEDFNLAQNLMTQWDGLSVKLQNEQEAALKEYERTLKEGSTNAKKAVDGLMRSLEKGVDDVTLPNGQKVTPLAAITDNFNETGDTVAVMKAAQDTLEAIRGVVIDQYNHATNQEDIDKLEEKYGAGLKNIDKELKVNIGGKNLTGQDVLNAVANEQFNNPAYSIEAVRNEATGRNEYKLKQNNVERLDYVRQFDEQGNEFFVPATIRTDQNDLMFGTSDQGRGINTQITNEGAVIGSKGEINAGTGSVERGQSQSIKNRLEELGYIVTQSKEDGTTIKIKLPNESVQRSATIQPDGSVRFYGDDGQLNEIGLVDRNLGSDMEPVITKAGETRVVSPEEISDFGTKSAFGGTLSQASAQGNRYISDILGKSKLDENVPLSGSIRYGNDFSGFGSAVTSNLLQTAGATKQQIKQEMDKRLMLQAQESAAAASAQLQASQTFNLNQTPVQQLTGQGILKKQLQVQPLAPAPRVVVAAPAPTARITGVTNGATDYSNYTKGVVQLPAQPRVRVY